MSSNSKIPQRQSNQASSTTITSHSKTTHATTTTKTLINSTTFISKKNEISENESNTRVVVKDEGYSTMSNELVNKIHSTNNSNKMKSILSISSSNIVRLSGGSTNSTSTTKSNHHHHHHRHYDKHNDSGIRISRTSGDSSSTSSPHVTATSSSSASSTGRTTSSSSTSSSSTNHSPRLITSIINEETFVNDIGLASTASNASTNKRKREIRKRYCFPTLKSFSYYYNNRYYHHHNQSSSSSSSSQTMLCKYLSESDLTSLANQLSSYDKDLTYNVYHLDTLYNNVDYILFNSYASDTELVYNYNRRHGTNQHFLNSNYKLYINDYFNQPYDGNDDDDEDDDEVEEEEDNDDNNDENLNVDESQIQPNEFFLSKEFLCDGGLLVDYELSQIEINGNRDDDDEENQFESNDFDCVDVYDFADYQYGKILNRKLLQCF